MKHLILLTLSILTISITSCKKEEIEENPNLVTIDPNNFKGDLESGKEATLDATKTYYLTGKFVVKSGATLTIPAGTVIKATENTDGVVRYIAVAQGGKIYINGTATNPVKMTSGKSSPAKSDWGGLVVCGKAPINTSTTTASAEVSDLTYGGSVSNDNSGTIKYLVIEYTGFAYTGTKEFNGLSLFGVGSGTTVEYVHANHNGDDGIEFFGGTVNGKYLISTDSDDDAIDFADGWAGTGEFWYIKNTAKAGIEGSNNGDNPSATPTTNATLKNISIIKGNLVNEEYALYLKEGAGKWNAQNIYVGGDFTKGIKIKSNDAIAIENVTLGYITFNPIQFDVTNPSTFIFSEYTGPNTTYITVGNNNGAGAGASAPSWSSGWTTIQ